MNNTNLNLDPIDGELSMASATLTPGQSVPATVNLFDGAGLPTSNLGSYSPPTLTSDNPAALTITPLADEHTEHFHWTLAVPTPPVAGTVNLTATLTPSDPSLPTLTATGTVEITVTPGVVSSITLTFGTPTP
jgi:hypothetical protein